MAAILQSYREAITFRPERFNPVLVASGAHMKAVLTCLEPGQFIPVHRPGVDMLPIVLEGEGQIVAGDRQEPVRPGTVVRRHLQMTKDRRDSHGRRASRSAAAGPATRRISPCSPIPKRTYAARDRRHGRNPWRVCASLRSWRKAKHVSRTLSGRTVRLLPIPHGFLFELPELCIVSEIGCGQ
jgi:hypothetical protein